MKDKNDKNDFESVNTTGRVYKGNWYQGKQHGIGY